MSNAISTLVGKSLVAITRIGSYALKLTAGHKLACFGYRFVHYIASPYTSSEWGQKIKAQTDSLGFKVYSNEDSKTSNVELLKQAAAIGLIACLFHDATFYIEGKAPKIYNTTLSITPIRVLDTSCPETVKRTIQTFNFREFFVDYMCINAAFSVY